VTGIHWRGHLFQFENPPAQAYPPAAGLRLLLIFAVLELIIGPRLWLISALHLPVPPAWLRISIVLALAITLVRFAARVKLADIGLIPWHDWTATEKSYFIQVFVLANVIFAIVIGPRLRALLAGPSVPYLLWGFHQELMYRGILQTELVRRWGAPAGILLANSLFTFGPLHFYNFTRTSSPLPLFAGIFAIGLFFALVFWRSGNLWIIAILHGVGDLYIEGTR
jgi:membrane protease YdiL (CAAX protease family)